jgi:hypothetical protein
MKDLQDKALAEHAKAYQQEQQRKDAEMGKQRSKTNSQRNQDWRNKMQSKYGT